jgi:transcriptional regulator with XRE-family HTH domain
MRGLSVTDLAERAQVSPSALRNWELENRALPTVKAERLCAALSIRIDAIDREAAADTRQASEPVAVRTAS